jgi:cytidylate kinase
MGLRIAIDGPAGAGKSTVTSRVAEAFGLPTLDTGAIYRTLALAASRGGISWEDAQALAELAARMPIRFAAGAPGEAQRVFLGEEDVSAAIRTPEMSKGSSIVSQYAPVRKALLPLQRRLSANGVVAEGRDIGSVVLPDAEVKIFLTASPRERARRRQLELQGKGIARSLDDVLAEQNVRDERDSTRATAPLRAAPDAVTVDTDGLTLDEVVQRVVDVVRRKAGSPPGSVC